jgi:hypothetical protein
MSRKSGDNGFSRVYRPLSFCCVTALALALMPGTAKAQTTAKAQAAKAKFCAQVGKKFQVSSGLQMYCFGPQRNGPGASSGSASQSLASAGLANVDAANRAEDRGGSGLYAYGQSETSIAASANYVVEAWNDATSFFNTCGAPMYKEEGTGYAFSHDGGGSFTDLGGLPNNNCSNGSRWFGDSSVGTYSNSGFTYFYISSLYACTPTSGCPNQPNGGIAVALTAAWWRELH